jgi:hypothetical protein
VEGAAMPITRTAIARLHAEAARCDRIATGLGDPDLVARLAAWATEYRADAWRLAVAGGDRR